MIADLHTAISLQEYLSYPQIAIALDPPLS